MPLSTRNRLILPLLAFFASGSASLLAEIAWIRAAALFLGSTTGATGAVIAVFLGGLALGSLVSGRLTHRIARPMRAAALVEFGAAVAVALSPWLLAIADERFGAAYRHFDGAETALLWVRVPLLAAAILLPAVAMGASLPLLCQRLASANRPIGSAALLYAWNTLGAAAGAALATFVIIPLAGVRATLFAASAIYVGAGVLLLTAARDEAPIAPPARPATAQPQRSWLLIAAVVGMVALGEEVLWTRYLGLLFTQDTYSFGLMLIAVLLGLVIGSALVARLVDRARQLPALFAGLQFAHGLAVLTAFLLPPESMRELADAPLVVLLLLLPPSILSGASLPCLLRLHADPAGVGSAVGRIVAANTIGGVIGSLAVSQVALHLAGMRACLLALTGASIAAGALAWLPRAPRRRAAIVVGATVALWLALPAWLPTRLPADLLAPRDRLIDHACGYGAYLAAVRERDVRRLEIDRWWQGEDRKTHQVMAAHLPLLLCAHPADALVVGVGAGQTPSRCLMHDLRHLDVVDVEPALFPFLRQNFASAWLDDPRVRVIAGDGRSHLRHTAATYDVVAIEVGQLFHATTAAFYTVDFYRRVRERLRPDGVISQFVPLPFLDEPALRDLLAAFAEVFPNASLWSNTAELLLIGTNADRLRIGAPFATRLATPAIRADLAFSPWGGAAMHLDRLEVLLGSFLAGPGGIRALAQGGTPLRDDSLTLDHRAARVRPGDARELDLLPLLRAHLDDVTPLLDLTLAADAMPRIALLRDANLRAIEADAWLRRAGIRERRGDLAGTRQLLERAIEISPEHLEARRRLADFLLRNAGPQAALPQLEAALKLDAHDHFSQRTFGTVCLQLDRLDDAAHHLGEVLERFADDGEAHNNFGIVLARRGRIDDATRHFEAAVRLDPTSADARRNLQMARNGGR